MQTIWNIWLHYWPDLAIAAVLAVIVDVLRVRSRILEGWRWLKDKNAEHSVLQINARIAEQEKYRDSLKGYLASDKLMYLAVLRSIVAILLIMSVAGIVVLIGQIGVMVLPVSETLRANIDETESAAIITERGGQENHRERSQNGSSFCSQFA